MIEQIIFYVFATILVVAGAMVVTAKSPIRSALFLVLAFFATAALWILLESEFLALILVLVYVGAVMTLFLFVVMMLNLDRIALREGFVRYLPFGLIVIALIVAFMLMVIGPRQFGLAHYANPANHPANYSNIRELGLVLYTQYAYPFILAGALLLVAIIAAISLTFRGPRDSKTQKPNKQILVKRADRIRIVKMPSEKKQ